MTEYKFVLPLGRTDVHAALSRTLVDLFGGFTAIDGQGAWKDDDGAIHKEPVRVYHVATNNRGMLLGAAMDAARQAHQTALYFDGDIHVCN